MISNTYSNKVLNALMGVSSFTSLSNVYLGLCENEPDVATGSLANAAEPTSVASYERKMVSGTGSSSSKYFSSAVSGIIKNNEEIQLKTAREDYPGKINYWFLSETSSGSAYMWGRIKDVLSDTKTVTGFMSESTYNTYVASATTEDLIDFKEGETYIVTWDDTEYEETAHVYEKDGVSYIRLGNALVSGGESDGKPFGILYSVSTTGTDTTGNLTIYSLTGEASHTVALYGVGIVIKKATVPTFYEGELQARLDA